MCARCILIRKLLPSNSHYFTTRPSSLEIGETQWTIVKWGIEKVLVNTGKSKHNSDWRAAFYTSSTLATWHGWLKPSASLWIFTCWFIHLGKEQFICCTSTYAWWLNYYGFLWSWQSTLKDYHNVYPHSGYSKNIFSNGDDWCFPSHYSDCSINANLISLL